MVGKLEMLELGMHCINVTLGPCAGLTGKQKGRERPDSALGRVVGAHASRRSGWSGLGSSFVCLFVCLILIDFIF